VAYLDVCAEEGETSLVAAALGDIARARNMSRLAGDAGQTREGL
jgi:probable addiction module antidote protein